MSDFDAVLERLLSDPSFAAALAADPDGALSGYRLDAGEADLLRSQLSSDAGGGPATVETRTNKSSTFGLFSAVADLGHSLTADGPWAGAGAGAGAATQHAAQAMGAGTGAGTAAQHAGEAIGGGGGGGADQQWLPPAHSGFGAAPEATSGFGAARTTGLESAGRAFGAAEHILPPQGYHPHIDADGDGHWDEATFVGTRSGGVEIFVDVNHDGHPDFVGHDTNRDGLVDYADYDKNDDGVFEKRMFDDNGDGWLDRTEANRDK
jgi:hypothetical protein